MTANLPRPLAAPGTVDINVADRISTVRPAPDADGYARLLWRQGYRALVNDPNPLYSRLPTPWAHGAGQHSIACGQHGTGGLTFKFHRGDTAYRELSPNPA